MLHGHRETAPPSPPVRSRPAAARRRRAQRFFPPLVVALAVVVVFGRTLQFDFVLYDDNFHITDNPHLAGPIWTGLARLWRAPYFGEYVPVTYTLFAAENWLAGRWLNSQRTAVFHMFSVALHLAVAISVYGLLRRFVAGGWAAAAGALLFALHPLQVESVAWVSQQRGLLAALFGVWSIGLYLESTVATAAGQSRRLSRLAYFAATACLAAALLSKPSAVAIPLMALAIDCSGFGRSWRSIARALWPWFVLAGGVAAVTKLQQPNAVIHDVAPLWARPLVAGDALAFYLAKFICPISLCGDYGRSPAAIINSGSVFWTWLVPLSVAAAIVWRGDRATRTAARLCVAALLPSLGLVPFAFQESSTVADRYVYLALFGPAWWLADRWTGMVRSDGWQKTAFACAGILFFWGTFSHIRADAWRDSQTLFSNILGHNVGSFVAHNNMSVLWRDWSRPDAANHSALIAIELRPHDANAVVNLGAAQWDLGQRDQAVESFRRATALAPDNRSAWRNLGLTLKSMGREEEATAALRELLSRWPKDHSARSALDELESRYEPPKPEAKNSPTQNRGP